MVDINELKNKIGKSTVDHLPEILTTVGVVGAIATPVLVYKAKPKIDDILDSDEYKRSFANAETPFKEKTVYLEYTWREWAPAFICGLLTVTAIIGAHVSSSKQKAMVLAAYGATSTALNEYRKHANEIIKDPKKIKDLDNVVAKKTMEQNPPSKKDVKKSHSTEDTLFFDWLTGRYFWSNKNKIDEAVNRTNFEINNSMWSSLNQFYDFLGLDSVGIGEDIGWNTDRLLEITYSSKLTDDMKSAVVMEFRTLPEHFTKEDRI